MYVNVWLVGQGSRCFSSSLAEMCQHFVCCYCHGNGYWLCRNGTGISKLHFKKQNQGRLVSLILTHKTDTGAEQNLSFEYIRCSHVNRQISD